MVKPEKKSVVGMILFILLGCILTPTWGQVSIKATGSTGQAERTVVGTVEVEDPPISGPLVAEGDIHFNSNAETHSYQNGDHKVLFDNGHVRAGQSLTLDSNAEVNGNAMCEDDLQMYSNAGITGNVSCGEDITLEGNAYVDGDAEADNSINDNTGGGGHKGIQGTASDNEDVDNSLSLPNISYPDDLPDDIKALTGVASSGIFSGGGTYPGGKYNGFTMSSGDSITLSGGAYWIDGDFTLDSNSIVTLTGACEIYIVDDLNMDSNSAIYTYNGVDDDYGLELHIGGSVSCNSNSNINMRDMTPKEIPGDPSKCHVYCATYAEVSIDSNYAWSCVLEVNGDITFKSNAHHWGSVTSNEGSITLDSNALFYYDERLGGASGAPLVDLEHIIETKN